MKAKASINGAFYRKILWIGNPEKLHVLGKFGKWRAPNRLLPGIGVVRIVQITLSDLRREEELMQVLNRIGKITDGKRKTKEEKIQNTLTNSVLAFVPKNPGKCSRCKGLLVRALLYDYDTPEWVISRRCPCCGHITDPIMERNRFVQKLQQQAREKEMPERGPYGQHEPVIIYA